MVWNELTDMLFFDKTRLANLIQGGIAMKNHTRITRLLTALLTLCVLFACMAGTALADEFKGYVGSIGIVAADSAAEAKAKLTSTGHTVLDMDLNEGTNSGKRIYMGYKTTMDPDQAIYGFGIFESNSSSATNWGGTFHAVGSSGEPNSAGGGKVNLNEGAGGKSLYLAVTRDKGFNDVPVTGIQLSHDINPSEAYPGDACSYTLDTSYGTSDRPHLNQDASGGSVIYLYYQRFIDTDTGVSLTAYYLSKSGAIQSSNVGKWLTNAAETVTFSAQPLTVTYNGMSYTFAGWHDANNATGAPENTSTTASAGMGSLGSTNFQSRYAAYKHDLKLSFNANGGTGANAVSQPEPDKSAFAEHFLHHSEHSAYPFGCHEDVLPLVHQRRRYRHDLCAGRYHHRYRGYHPLRPLVGQRRQLHRNG